MTKIILSLFFVFVIKLNTYAQSGELFDLASKFLSESSYKQKIEANKKFTQLLSDELNNPDNFGFSDLPSNISVIKSPDQNFVIYTWAITDDEGNYLNKGLIQLPAKRGSYSSVIPLMNSSKTISNVQLKTLGSDEWIGAVYYQIIPTKIKKNKVYVLLGIDGNNKLTTKKIIDVVWMDGEEIKFGYPIFISERKTYNRIIFEYSAQASMSLRYQKKSKMIIFDHLAPSNPAFQGQYQFYGPDFSYDAYLLKGGKWVYEKDVDARNETENLGKKTKEVQKGL
jgi:hypothetical protein